MDCEIQYRIVTWLLVVLGWLVVARVQERRTIKNNLQDRAAKIITKVEDVELDAISFYTKPGNENRQDEERVKIVAKLSRLGHDSALIIKNRKHNIFDRISDYRRTITLNDFDLIERPACTAADQKILNIIEASQALSAAIQDSVDRTVKRNLRLK